VRACVDVSEWISACACVCICVQERVLACMSAEKGKRKVSFLKSNNCRFVGSDAVKLKNLQEKNAQLGK